MDKELKDYLKQKRDNARNVRKELSFIKRELKLLKFMLKNDVFFYHHSTKDSIKNEIIEAIDFLKRYNKFEDRNGVLSLFGNIWRNNEFETIYDVPLDGTYIFYIYDSGQRGLGSCNIITASKKDSINIPYVNSGSFPPIKAF